VTGAGDALVAGTLYGLLNGDALPAAVRSGAFAAALTIEAPTTVSRALTRAALDRLRTAAAVRT
jgi:pseudouridine kinase